MRQLIEQRLESIAQLEVLLLPHGSPQHDWSAEAVSNELRIDPRWAAEQLAVLRQRGLLRHTDPGRGLYRFGAVSPDLEGVVDGLAGCYASRRVGVVALLYSRPLRTIRNFADAFRIWRDRERG